MYGIKTEAHFDAAHFLTDYHGKCENLHGHRWRVVVYLSTKDLQKEGNMRDMVLDFGVFKRMVRDLAEEFDHTFLVEEGSLKPETVSALEGEGFTLTFLPFRTTSENLARYFAEQLIQSGFPIAQIEMYETPNNCAIWRA
jgi:6-pyruvoyltetrahydropterin/6-carboxytetrahydropterin synthase